MEEGQWLKLVDYGDYPHAEGMQRVTFNAAREMQRKFRSLRARLARKFGGIPIYIGHPDDKNFAKLPGHSDTRSYAWVQDVEARVDGIWILPKWSEVGQKMIKNSFFKFLSPRWEMKRNGQFLIPIRLISVGLTNHPNIPGDVIANQFAGEILPDTNLQDNETSKDISFTARDGIDEKSDPQNNTIESRDFCAVNYEQISRLLRDIFSIDLEQSISQIRKTLEEIASQASRWQKEGANLKNINKDLVEESERFYKIACEKEEQVKVLTAQLTNEKISSGENFINFALTRGLILSSEADSWKEKYIMDPHTASNELLGHACILNTTSKTETLRNQININNKDFILNLVNQRMASSGDDYTEAWKAVKKLHPALF